MNRRGFLQTRLALAAAPAIVRADSLMKLWVPPQNLAPALSDLEFFSPQIESCATGYIGSVRIFNKALSNWELHQITMESEVQPVLRIDANGLSIEGEGRITGRNISARGKERPTDRAVVTFTNEKAYMTLGDPRGMHCHGGTQVCIQPPLFTESRDVHFPLLHNLDPVPIKHFADALITSPAAHSSSPTPAPDLRLLRLGRRLR